MPRVWAAWLLAFCLVSSQQGALLHELSHDAPRVGAHQDTEADSHAAGVHCDLCLAFEHLAGVVATAFVILALLSTEEHWSSTARFARRAAAVPQACARDPPALF